MRESRNRHENIWSTVPVNRIRVLTKKLLFWLGYKGFYYKTIVVKRVMGTFCVNCGNEIKEGTKYCSKCGYRVSQRKEEKNGKLNKKNSTLKNKGHGRMIFIILLLAIFISGVLIICKQWLDKNSPKETNDIVREHVSIEIKSVNEEKGTAEAVISIPDMQTCYEYATAKCKNMDTGTEEYAEKMLEFIQEAMGKYSISEIITVEVKKENQNWVPISDEEYNIYVEKAIDSLFAEIIKSEGNIIIEYEGQESK